MQEDKSRINYLFLRLTTIPSRWFLSIFYDDSTNLSQLRYSSNHFTAYFRHNSQYTLNPIPLCCILYSYCASTLHPPNMPNWLRPNPHTEHRRL